MEAWLDEFGELLPDGLLEWSRGFPTFADGFPVCPSAEWRLWLAKYLATTNDEHLRCARAAFHVARTLIASLRPPQTLATRAIDLAEGWAVTRSRDEGYQEAIDALDGACRASMPNLSSLVTSAMWFADFEACAGFDGACNVLDLFIDARAQARLVGGDAREQSLLRELADDFRTMLPMPTRTIPVE